YMVKTTVNIAKGMWREKRKISSVLGKVVTEKEESSLYLASLVLEVIERIAPLVLKGLTE
ncbi:hypothetical protein Tco_0885400, partial [Tanacetum coccineum]